MLYKYVKVKKPPDIWHLNPRIIKIGRDRLAPWYLGIPHPKTIKRLISYKENAELTFDDLALETGFGRHTLIRWMNGQARPNRRSQKKLRRFLSWY